MSFDFNSLAQQFVQVYYQQFEADRSTLGSLYRDTSMMTFETSQVQGAQAIVEKLTSLPFQKTQHKVTTLDAQPGSPGSQDVIVMVTGQLTIDDEAHPKGYSQVFHLVQDGGQYFVFNDIFRLILG